MQSGHHFALGEHVGEVRRRDRIRQMSGWTRIRQQLRHQQHYVDMHKQRAMEPGNTRLHWYLRFKCLIRDILTVQFFICERLEVR